MRLLGFNIKAEESISKGRSDAVVFTDSHIYIFEFKMFPVTAKKAIEQIKTKGYDKPYLTDKRKKILVGISFKAEEKNIFEYEAEESISKGRSDAVILTDTHIYIFEFKMFPVTAKKAIEQIKTKEYSKPYLTDNRKKVLIGVSFKAEDKNIFEYEVEEIKS